MNGRVYDPVLGRFLSVDPVFQFPTNTQSLNPYSYVLNNPLSATDPTGYTENCTAGQTAGCPPEGQIKAGDTAHQSYTPTGSHIAVSVTARGNADGSVTVTSSNNQTGKAVADNVSKMVSSANGEQNSQQGAGTIMATSKSQGAGTSQNTATQAASVNSTTSGNSASQLTAANLNGLSQNMTHGEPYLDARTLDKVKNWESGIDAEYDGYKIDFTNAFRTKADIDALRELGYKPSENSLHMAGLAVDIDWNSIPKYMRSGVVGIARASGLQWGGNFKNQPIDEKHHFYDLGSMRGSTRGQIIQAAQKRYEELTGGHQ